MCDPALCAGTLEAKLGQQTPLILSIPSSLIQLDAVRLMASAADVLPNFTSADSPGNDSLAPGLGRAEQAERRNCGSQLGDLLADHFSLSF